MLLATIAQCAILVHLLPIMSNYRSHRATFELFIDNSVLINRKTSPTPINKPPTNYKKLETREKSHFSTFTQINEILLLFDLTPPPLLRDGRQIQGGWF